MKLYQDWTPFYRLFTPPEEYAAEAAAYRAGFESAAPSAETLLELGAGAGHNAVHLKQRYRCTLTDLSEPMLALSRELNPECEHLLGDMRSLQLERTFDIVFVHDAVMYMLSEADLRAAIATAFIHTAPGGAAIFAPDCFRENFHEETVHWESGDAERQLRCTEWSWDPDPKDDWFAVEYAVLLREAGEVQMFHDHQQNGLFSREVWRRLLHEAGYTTQLIDRPLDDGALDQVWLCRRSG
ncbi:MAG: class I SAM-dependent methyltransferase [Polyangiaceae bacterium]|nr:class I SAM-dependent methyltransferase [Polyangiaceae bacterium]